MIGILTEKPSAARNFAKALGARKSGSCFTGTFQGEPFLIVHSVEQGLCPGLLRCGIR